MKKRFFGGLPLIMLLGSCLQKPQSPQTEAQQDHGRPGNVRSLAQHEPVSFENPKVEQPIRNEKMTSTSEVKMTFLSVDRFDTNKTLLRIAEARRLGFNYINLELTDSSMLIIGKNGDIEQKLGYSDSDLKKIIEYARNNKIQLNGWVQQGLCTARFFATEQKVKSISINPKLRNTLLYNENGNPLKMEKGGFYLFNPNSKSIINAEMQLASRLAQLRLPLLIDDNQLYPIQLIKNSPELIKSFELYNQSRLSQNKSTLSFREYIESLYRERILRLALSSLKNGQQRIFYSAFPNFHNPYFEYASNPRNILAMLKLNGMNPAFVPELYENGDNNIGFKTSLSVASHVPGTQVIPIYMPGRTNPNTKKGNVAWFDFDQVTKSGLFERKDNHYLRPNKLKH
jgi:hypothetical protein